jgi:Gas vesicle protein G
MFLLDDILLSPVKGLASICRKVEEAARQDLENQEKGTMSALSELHRRLEMGEIDEQQFDCEETKLLERTESLARTLHQNDEP